MKPIADKISAKIEVRIHALSNGGFQVDLGSFLGTDGVSDSLVRTPIYWQTPPNYSKEELATGISEAVKQLVTECFDAKQ